MVTYYFAYGSNLHRPQMLIRCPQSTPFARGKLRNWEFVINDRGVATLKREEGSHVWGVIYALHGLDEAYLDMHEGVHIGKYGKFVLPIEIHKSQEMKPCLVYIDPTSESGAPRPGYLEKILEGAEAFHLPEKYIRSLKAWSNYE